MLQTGGFLPYLTVGENIGLSRRLLGLPADGTVEHLARILGVERHLSKLPAFLSAGERQHVAVARALAHRPSIVIADEPTVSLDPITARRVLAAVMDLVKGARHHAHHREPRLGAGYSICFLLPRHFLAALSLTLIASLLGAVLGGVRAARIEPSDRLREVGWWDGRTRVGADGVIATRGSACGSRWRNRIGMVQPTQCRAVARRGNPRLPGWCLGRASCKGSGGIDCPLMLKITDE
ncbi:MAG: ATP-binding cassette domain-containing protein [Gammaproteobacteria bacterium]